MPQPQDNCAGYCINFNDIPVIEFIRFVSKVSEENFIYDSRDLNFNISLSTGKSVSSDMILQALVQLLRVHGLTVSADSGYFVIHKSDDAPGSENLAGKPWQKGGEGLIASNSPKIDVKDSERYEFFVYKLQYHEGPEIEESLKKVASDLRSQPDAPVKLINAIQSLQWVRATNSLLFSADPDTLQKLSKLVDSLDIPLRQVFIEVLVIETDVKKSMEFGLQWAAGGQYGSKMGFGLGNFAPGSNAPGGFASTMKGINATNTPTGLDQIPLVPGFDLGVIGDVIRHKGKSYFSLGSLVSALQVDGSSTIVLNQKIITQDNKNSTIFVGDNIPFTGSVVQTVGQSQQTTANIEYRDIGVSLSITPRLGEGDVITLNLNEEITESIDHDPMNSNTQVNGIRTTKTNMATHVHVPDKHFLVLSGMIRNTKAQHKAGLPCLGGLPWIGAAFSKTRQNDEKRNVIIFVRPHIIHSFQDYQRLTENQEEIYRSQANAREFDQGVELVNP
ncbi:MAG: type II secretion system protein GspD [Verrucomicrobia bacterium]|nr:type II secretion system protein GspD [Verrucomicrobiota bacterium]